MGQGQEQASGAAGEIHDCLSDSGKHPDSPALAEVTGGGNYIIF